MRPVLGTKPPTAFISVDLPAPFAPMRPTTSPRPTSRSTPSTTTRLPKRTVTPVTDERGRDRRGGSGVARERERPCSGEHLRGLGRLGPPGGHPAEHQVPDGVQDLDQAAGEVQEEDEQADAAGEQPDLGVVGEEGREPDDPERPQDGPVTEARPPTTAMDTTRSDSMAEEAVGLEGDEQPAEQAAGQAGEDAADPERGQLGPGGREAEGGGGPLVVAHRDHRAPDAAAPDRGPRPRRPATSAPRQRK